MLLCEPESPLTLQAPPVFQQTILTMVREATEAYRQAQSLQLARRQHPTHYGLTPTNQHASTDVVLSGAVTGTVPVDMNHKQLTQRTHFEMLSNYALRTAAGSLQPRVPAGRKDTTKIDELLRRLHNSS